MSRDRVDQCWLNCTNGQFDSPSQSLVFDFASQLRSAVQPPMKPQTLSACAESSLWLCFVEAVDRYIPITITTLLFMHSHLHSLYFIVKAT